MAGRRGEGPSLGVARGPLLRGGSGGWATPPGERGSGPQPDWGSPPWLGSDETVGEPENQLTLLSGVLQRGNQAVRSWLRKGHRSSNPSKQPRRNTHTAFPGLGALVFQTPPWRAN